ncbi:peptidoglycan-binding domain-containing protein [Streptomyces sp. DB-54]
MTAASTCPHCFAPVRGDGRPTCLCAAVESEDFDPLRVRPYVSLPDRGGREDDGGSGSNGEDGGGWRRPDALEDLPGVDAAVHRVPRPTGPASETFHSSGSPDPSDSPDSPDPSDSFRPAGFAPSSGAAAAPPAPAGRRRTRSAFLAVTGAAVAAAAIVLGSGALQGGDRDRAAPPDGGTPAPTATVPTAAGPTGSAPAPDRPSPATSRSRSPGATTRPRRSPTPSLPPTPVRASGSVAVPTGDAAPSAPPSGPIVLREGSSGPEVAELQGRLRQVALYTGTADGQYGTAVREAVARYQRTYGVQGDPDGVYGPATRVSLEARTRQP